MHHHRCLTALSKAHVLIIVIFLMSVFMFWTALLPYETSSCDLNQPRLFRVKDCACDTKRQGQLLKTFDNRDPSHFTSNKPILQPQDTLANKLEITKRIETELEKIEISLDRVLQKSRSGEVIMGIQSAIGTIQSLKELIRNKDKLGPNADKKILREKDSLKETKMVIPGKKYLVCPEMFNGTTFGYPFFYKGFVDLPCLHLPLSSLITILINIGDYSKESLVSVPLILRGISKHFKGIQLLVGYKAGQNIKNFKVDDGNVIFKEFSRQINPGLIWNDLIGQVKTQFVLIGRNMQTLTWDIRLDRLIREAELLDSPMVGGALRTSDGHWSMGCQQFRYRNYTLVYKSGYELSKHECVFCDHMQGPFVAKTKFMMSYPFSVSLPKEGLFESFFLHINQILKKQYPVCPDSMFHVETTPNPERNIWIPFAKRWNINRLRFSSGQLFEFSCQESKSGFDRGAGMAQSPCKLQELADVIKVIMTLCEKNNILCELQEGTALGAVKFNKVLPWELDADITFHSSNFSKFEALKDSFQQLGYGLSVIKKPWCCADGVIAGGIFNVYSQNWNVEMYGQHIMDSEKMILKGLTPTKVHFDGQWVNVPTNPGLFVRNRYGHEIYQHAQHWMTLGHSTGWAQYTPSKFQKCSKPGDMACLDQYLADGNLQFGEPLI